MQLKHTCRFDYIRRLGYSIAHVVNSIIRKFYVPGNAEIIEVLPLTPICDASDIAPYANRLRFAMDKADLLNIAVTGRFGAGKSSFLKTYFRNARVLWISLAPFINTLPKLKGKGYYKDRDLLGRKLESSVLQQMFYTAKASELPFSRFSRIGSNGVGEYLLASIMVVLALVSLLLIMQPHNLWKHVDPMLYVGSDVLFIFGLFISIFPLIFGVMIICDVVRKARIMAKINAVCAQIEMGKDCNDLAFNKVLDEVVYHFQRIHYEAVVFEDLDRFPDTFIFAKLKEVNQLVNSTRDINWRHKPIKFIYAVRDTILGDVERVKFFDYILPVIPSMTAANSKDIFVNCIKRVLKTDVLSGGIDSLIRTVSKYIYDRRLLHNICNEYAVFKERLGDDISDVNLLAYVLYKNVLPEDFEALQEGHGVFYELIERKNQLVSEEVLKNNSEIKIVQEKIEAAEKTNSFELQHELDSVLESLKRQNREVASRVLRDWISIGRIDIKTVYGLMGLYESGKDTLSNNWYEVNRANLLFALVSSGWLTEQYKHYIVSHTDAIITDQDYSFVLSCINNVSPDETYVIQNLKDVISEIPMISYNTKCILNFSLVREFLVNAEVPADKKSVLFANIFNSEGPAFEFIDRFLEHYQNDSLVYECFGKAVKPTSWRYVRQLVDSNAINTEGKLRQLGVLYRHGVWYLNPFDHGVINFLASHVKIIAMFSSMGIETQKIESFLRNCKIPFKDIDLSEVGAEEVLKVLVESGSYLMCENMVSKILIGYGVFDDVRWREGRGTLMVDANIPSLIRRIKGDINMFLERVYLCAEAKQSEEQKFFDLVFSYNDMPDELLDRFLEKQNKSVSDITYIEKVNICVKLAEKGLIKYTWKNMIDLFCRLNEIQSTDEKAKKLGIVSRLLEFGKDELLNDTLPPYSDDYRPFVEYVLNDKIQSDDLVLYIASSYKGNLHDFVPNSDVSANRVMALAELKVVAFSKELYNWLKAIGVDKAARYIELNANEYLNKAGDFDFEEDVFEQLLQSKRLDSKFKYGILAENCNNVCGSDKLKRLIAQDIGVSNFEKYPPKLVCECFRYLSPVAVQCKIISAYKFDRKNTIIALNLMIEPYKKLTKIGQTMVLPFSEIVKELLNRLKVLGVVREYVVDKDKGLIVKTEAMSPSIN